MKSEKEIKEAMLRHYANYLEEKGLQAELSKFAGGTMAWVLDIPTDAYGNIK